MGTVTPLAAAIKAAPRLDPISQEIDYDNIAETLRNEIRFAHFTNGTPIYRMAKAMKVSAGTVSKMMHGETKFPRFSTVNMMLSYFGYRLYARRN